MVPQTPVEPTQSPKAILNRAALDIRTTKPTWHLMSPVCNFPPLMNEQESFSCAFWTVGSDLTPIASVTIHQITNAEVVSRWMQSYTKRSSPGWFVVPYDLGVPAYVSTLQNPPSVSITFGKGRFIGEISGKSKVDVDRVARALLRQISN
jgi:hypothetical protein